MRKDIQQIIKVFYPLKTYTLPQDRASTALDMDQASSLAKQIRKITKTEVAIEKEDEYRVSWNFGIFFPTKRQVYVNKMSNKPLNTEPRYVLYVSVSNLARYYLTFWNELKISDGVFKHRLLFRNPKPDLRTIESRIRTVFENNNFSRLSNKELNEQVKWLRPGTSAIDGIPTVYNCLFSEV